MLRSTLVATVLLLSVSASFANPFFADPPTQEEIRAKVNEFFKGYQELSPPENPTPEQMADIEAKMADRAAKLLEGIEIASLSDEARAGLAPLLQSSPRHRAIVLALLDEKAKGNDLAGFRAACERIGYAGDKPEAR